MVDKEAPWQGRDKHAMHTEFTWEVSLGEGKGMGKREGNGGREEGRERERSKDLYDS